MLEPTNYETDYSVDFELFIAYTPSVHCIKLSTVYQHFINYTLSLN